MGTLFYIATGSLTILLDTVFNYLFVALGLLAVRIHTLLQHKPSHRFPFGYYSFEPLLVATKGIVILAALLTSLLLSIQSFKVGGKFVAIQLGIVYAAISSVLSAGFTIHQHAAGKYHRSELVVADAKFWLTNTFLSLGVLASFLFMFALQQLAPKKIIRRVLPFVDPFVVIVLVLISLPLPLDLVSQAPAALLLLVCPL